MPDSFQIEAIARASELCEQRLREPVSVAEMADAACYSLFHFCRVFVLATGHTPHRYLLRRRLSESAAEVENSDRNLSEIAFDYCFGAPETYARAFRRVFGALPSDWRKSAPHDPRLRLPPFDEPFLRHLHERVTFHMEPPAVPACLFGLMTPAVDDETPLHLRRRLRELTATAAVWGARIFPPDWPRRPWLYFAGVETPPEWPHAVLDIPACAWSAATHIGGLTLVPRTLDCLRFVRQANTLPTRAPQMTLELIVAETTTVLTPVSNQR